MRLAALATCCCNKQPAGCTCPTVPAWSAYGEATHANPCALMASTTAAQPGYTVSRLRSISQGIVVHAPVLVAGAVAARPRPAASAQSRLPARPRAPAARPAAGWRPRGVHCLPLPTPAGAASAGCTCSATGPCTGSVAGCHRVHITRGANVSPDFDATHMGSACSSLLQWICMAAQAL